MSCDQLREPVVEIVQPLRNSCNENFGKRSLKVFLFNCTGKMTLSFSWDSETGRDEGHFTRTLTPKFFKTFSPLK